MTDQAVRPGPAFALALAGPAADRQPAGDGDPRPVRRDVPDLRGHPAAARATPPSSSLGINATQEQVQEFRDKLNLDDLFLVRYFHWLGDVLTGNLGQLAGQRPAGDLDPERRAADDVPAARLRALHLARADRAARAPGGAQPRRVRRPRRDGDEHGRPLGRQLRARGRPRLRLRGAAGLAAGDLHQRHRHAGRADQVAHPARDRHRLPALLLLHPPAARGHPRADAGRGLRRHGEGQGRRAVARARAPRAAQLALRAADDRGAEHRDADRRDGDHRADLRRAGDRPLAPGGDQQPRRAGGRGDRPRSRRGRRDLPTCSPTCSTRCWIRGSGMGAQLPEGEAGGVAATLAVAPTVAEPAARRRGWTRNLDLIIPGCARRPAAASCASCGRCSGRCRRRRAATSSTPTPRRSPKGTSSAPTRSATTCGRGCSTAGATRWRSRSPST